MSELTPKRVPHVSGLKGAACVLVMFSHYIEIYTAAQSFSPSLTILDTIRSSPLGLAFNAGYWLSIFYVTSGYLAARSCISSFSGLVKKTVNRLFRFALPVFFSYLFIYLFFYKVFGFHTADTLDLFSCRFYQMNFLETYSLADVLRAPYDVLFSGRYVLNPPYWVLVTMFYSSIIIYVLKYIFGFLEHRSDWVKVTYWFAAFVVSAFADHIVGACMIGAIVAVFEENISHYKSSPAFWFFVMVLPVSLYCLPEELIWCISFAFVLVCIPKIKVFSKLFSSRFLLFLDRISWEIYSFHMPIISSAGALMLIFLTSSCGLKTAFPVTVVSMIALCFLASLLYMLTFERLSARIAAGIRKLLDRVPG